MTTQSECPECGCLLEGEQVKNGYHEACFDAHLEELAYMKERGEHHAQLD